MSRPYFAAAIIAVISSISNQLRAEAPSPCVTITRENLIGCAMSGSLAVRRDRYGTQAAEGRVQSTRPLFPANPVLSGSLARREGRGSEPTATNWSATLAQEVEIAGQRGARRDAAENEKVAQVNRTLMTERETGALAWTTYFDVIALREELRLAERIQKLGTQVAVAARARADRGVLSTVDADLAEAAQTRLAQERSAIDRRFRSAATNLITLVGGDPMVITADTGVRIDGDLTALRSAEVASRESAVNFESRPDVAAFRAEQRAEEARASVFRRARVPNITVSVFAQNDGYNERVLGVGLGVPIPIPGIGRTYAGEIAEAEALEQRASTEADRLKRDARRELANAVYAYVSRRTELEAFPRDRLERAERSLSDIAKEIEGGRVGVRDALLAQQTLIELLRSHIEVRRALCLASVDLSRAANVALERGDQ